jgi:transposase-like protein
MDEVVVGWQAAAAASRRTESWLRRHPDLTGGRKNDDGNWEFPVAALERLRPEGVADTVEPDADVRAADDDDEVVRIRTEPAVPSTNATPPTEAVQMVPVATVADEHGITGEMYAVVFEALDGGMRISEIVRQHKLLPQIAEVIVAAWRHVNEIDLNGPAVPAVVARQEKRLATQEARIVELEKYIAEVVEVHNALADTVDPQGGADATAPAVEHVDLPARVAELASAVDEIREFLAGFVPAVMLRRDIASVVRDKPLLLLPVTLRRMFAMPVPPGTCDYYES